MKNVAMIFSGYGTQKTGMGKGFYDRSVAVKTIFEQASDITRLDIKRICFENAYCKGVDISRLQPALVTVGYSQFISLQESLDVPFSNGLVNIMAGHSLGQSTAMIAAGSLSFEQGVEIVKKRSKLVKESIKKGAGLVAVKSKSYSDIPLSQRLSEYLVACNVHLACENSRHQLTFGGYDEDLGRFMKDLKKKEGDYVKAVKLPIDVPSHTPLLSEVVVRLKELIPTNPFVAPWTGLIANTTANVIHTPDEFLQEFYDSLTKPVRWRESVELIEAFRADVLIEFGAKPVLKSFFRGNSQEILAVHDVESLEKTVGRLKELGFKDNIK
ncbi:ACP S-malonyltransferase [Candidatus Woesearchaeota archaeon]|nr:ACP S-malonyltransferase [Candidatus Woesearchaeota archaeon]